MVEEVLNDILAKTIQYAQNGVWSFVYTVVEQGMLDLLFKDIIEERLEAYKATNFDTDVAADKVSERLLPSRLFVTPAAWFVRCKTDTTMDTKK